MLSIYAYAHAHKYINLLEKNIKLRACTITNTIRINHNAYANHLCLAATMFFAIIFCNYYYLHQLQLFLQIYLKLRLS